MKSGPPHPAISTEVIHDLAQFSKEIVSGHRPTKLYLNKKTEISKSNLGKLLKLFEIEKAVFLTEAQSAKRSAAVELQSEFDFGSEKWYYGSHFG